MLLHRWCGEDGGRRIIQEISGSESAAPVEEQKANGLLAIARGNAVGEMEPNNI